MKNIANMYVIQGRVFPLDVVPYRLIITPLGTNILKQALGFRDASWNQETWDYAFQDGTLERGAGEGAVAITAVGFSERRIVLQVLGDSDAAHAVYLAVSEVLAQLAPGFQDHTPLVFSEETSCVAQLDFEWTALFNPTLIEFAKQRVHALSTEEIDRAIKGVSVRFTIGATLDERLRDYGITFSDQTIAVEPRADVPLSERTYFTYSPGSSAAHLARLEELEGLLSKSKGKRHS